MLTKASCQISGEELPLQDLIQVGQTSSYVRDMLLQKKPDLQLDGYVSKALVGRLRLEEIKKELAEEKGELSSLQREVFHSLEQA